MNDNVAFCTSGFSNTRTTTTFYIQECNGCTVTIDDGSNVSAQSSSGPKNFDSVILTAPAIMWVTCPLSSPGLALLYWHPAFPAWSLSVRPTRQSADHLKDHATVVQLLLEGNDGGRVTHLVPEQPWITMP
jgi:hypothetical protein